MMNDTVARIVEIMFQDVEMNEEVAAIRDEVMNNCQERYTDLVNSGVGEDDAIAAVIESLKGMEDVLAPYKKKVQRNEDAPDGEQHVNFAAHMVHGIDVSLINEDVHVEASDDEEYHVLWDADDAPLLKVELKSGVLRIHREEGEMVKNRKEHIKFSEERMDDFIKTEEGKIEINMDSISRAMKSMGEKMKLMFSEGVKISVGSTWGSVTIQVPENAVPYVKLLTTSGDISVQDVVLTDVQVTSTSGDIDIDLPEEYRAERVDVRTTSGDIEVNAFVERMSTSSTSGDVEAEGRVNDLTVSTISGDIDVRADVVNMTFKAISGDVDMTFDSDELRVVNGSTISGDIEIDLPDSVGTMAIQTQTRSGDVTTRCHTNGFGPTVSGSVSSMSGDITIR